MVALTRHDIETLPFSVLNEYARRGQLNTTDITEALINESPKGDIRRNEAYVRNKHGSMRKAINAKPNTNPIGIDPDTGEYIPLTDTQTALYEFALERGLTKDEALMAARTKDAWHIRQSIKKMLGRKIPITRRINDWIASDEDTAECVINHVRYWESVDHG